MPYCVQRPLAAWCSSLPLTPIAKPGHAPSAPAPPVPLPLFSLCTSRLCSYQDIWCVFPLIKLCHDPCPGLYATHAQTCPSTHVLLLNVMRLNKTQGRLDVMPGLLEELQTIHSSALCGMAQGEKHPIGGRKDTILMRIWEHSCTTMLTDLPTSTALMRIWEHSCTAMLTYSPTSTALMSFLLLVRWHVEGHGSPPPSGKRITLRKNAQKKETALRLETTMRFFPDSSYLFAHAYTITINRWYLCILGAMLVLTFRLVLPSLFIISHRHSPFILPYTATW